MVSFSWVTPGSVTSLSPSHRETSCSQCPCRARDMFSGSIGAYRISVLAREPPFSSPSAFLSRLTPYSHLLSRPHWAVPSALSELDVIFVVVLTLCFASALGHVPAAWHASFFSCCAPFSVFGSSSSYFQSMCVSQALGSCWWIKEWWLCWFWSCCPWPWFVVLPRMVGRWCWWVSRRSLCGQVHSPRPVEELEFTEDAVCCRDLGDGGWGGAGGFQPSKVDAEFRVYAHFLWRRYQILSAWLKIRN